MPLQNRIRTIQTPMGEVVMYDGELPPLPTGRENTPAALDVSDNDLIRSLRPGERLCGFRIVGGVYWTFEGAYARTTVPEILNNEMAQYVLLEPIPIDPAAFGVSPVGVTLMERNGVTHVLDWVGESHYPTVQSFVEEVRRMGLSRRMPRNMDFSRFDEDSRILLIHRHAGGENRPAIFGSFPMTALEVIRDPIAQTDIETGQRAGHASVSVRFVDR